MVSWSKILTLIGAGGVGAGVAGEAIINSTPETEKIRNPPAAVRTADYDAQTVINESYRKIAKAYEIAQKTENKTELEALTTGAYEELRIVTSLSRAKPDYSGELTKKVKQIRQDGIGLTKLLERLSRKAAKADTTGTGTRQVYDDLKKVAERKKQIFDDLQGLINKAASGVKLDICFAYAEPDGTVREGYFRTQDKLGRFKTYHGLARGIERRAGKEDKEEIKRITLNLKIRRFGLGTALEFFYMDNGRFPTTEEGFKALFEPPKGTEKRRGSYQWRGPYLHPIRKVLERVGVKLIQDGSDEYFEDYEVVQVTLRDEEGNRLGYVSQTGASYVMTAKQRDGRKPIVQTGKNGQSKLTRRKKRRRW